MKIIFLSIVLIGMCFAQPQLQLVNVVFRHGDRTPIGQGMFPTDPYINCSFYPMGHGALTNGGKYRVYQLGQFLRSRYNDFLGEICLPNLLSARSSDFDRTKMSLQLVLAALFPPSDIERWNSALDWQLIPFTALPKHFDDLLAVQDSFVKEFKRVIQSEDIQGRFKSFEKFRHELETLTEMSMASPTDIMHVYDTLYAESKMNLTLPRWSAGIFPDGELLDGALIVYDIITYDKNIVYEIAGNLTSKIRDDILAVADKTKESEGKKLILYSAHDINVVGILKYLQVYTRRIPTYASAVIIELHEENNKPFVKVLYYDGDSLEAKELEMPGCSVLCPLEKYLDVVKETLK